MDKTKSIHGRIFASDDLQQIAERIRGLVLTMKITDWKLAREIPRWKDQLRGLGFQVVKSRQLAFNRKEICLVAIRDKYALRSSRKSRNS